MVTHMSLVFSLLSMLLPHIQLSPWQQQLAAQSQRALLGLLQQIGAAASVAGDTLTSVEAAWRAGTAVLQVMPPVEGTGLSFMLFETASLYLLPG